MIGELADVFDEEFPEYVVEEDKTLQYKQMIISSTNEKSSEEKVEEETENKQKSKYHPFED